MMPDYRLSTAGRLNLRQKKIFPALLVSGPALLAVLTVLMVVLPACGKKGPPVPLSHIAPPVVEELSLVREGNTAILHWPVPAWEKNDKDALAGFYVYQSTVALPEADDCPDCPMKYEKIADIRIQDAASAGVYEAPLENGFRYFFKVAAYTEKGYEGEKSAAAEVKITGVKP